MDKQKKDEYLQNVDGELGELESLYLLECQFNELAGLSKLTDNQVTIAVEFLCFVAETNYNTAAGRKDLKQWQYFFSQAHLKHPSVKQEVGLRLGKHFVFQCIKLMKGEQELPYSDQVFGFMSCFFGWPNNLVQEKLDIKHDASFKFAVKHIKSIKKRFRKAHSKHPEKAPLWLIIVISILLMAFILLIFFIL